MVWTKEQKFGAEKSHSGGFIILRLRNRIKINPNPCLWQSQQRDLSTVYHPFPPLLFLLASSPQFLPSGYLVLCKTQPLDMGNQPTTMKTLVWLLLEQTWIEAGMLTGYRSVEYIPTLMNTATFMNLYSLDRCVSCNGIKNEANSNFAVILIRKE